jgi:hypothetical protein
VLGVKRRKLVALGLSILVAGCGLAYCYCLPLTRDPGYASSWQRVTAHFLRNDSSLDRSIWQTLVFNKRGDFVSASSMLGSELKTSGFSERHRSESWCEWQAGDTVVSISKESNDKHAKSGSCLVLEVSRRQSAGLLSEWKLAVHKIIATRK